MSGFEAIREKSFKTTRHPQKQSQSRAEASSSSKSSLYFSLGCSFRHPQTNQLIR